MEETCIYNTVSYLFIRKKKKTLLIIQYHSESESSLSFMFIEQTGVA